MQNMLRYVFKLNVAKASQFKNKALNEIFCHFGITDKKSR